MTSVQEINDPSSSAPHTHTHPYSFILTYTHPYSSILTLNHVPTCISHSTQQDTLLDYDIHLPPMPVLK